MPLLLDFDDSPMPPFMPMQISDPSFTPPRTSTFEMGRDVQPMIGLSL